jgi:hypothetical protein
MACVVVELPTWDTLSKGISPRAIFGKLHGMDQGSASRTQEKFVEVDPLPTKLQYKIQVNCQSSLGKPVRPASDQDYNTLSVSMVRLRPE